MTQHLVIASDILLPELTRLLSEGKQVRFTPSGVSMRPFIEGDKDSVIIAPLTREPRRGDILLVKLANNDKSARYVLHRLVRKDTSFCVLQGDGNLIGEERCRCEDILGIVTAIERPDGRRKCLTNGRLWFFLKPIRKYLLKIYRKCVL